MLQFILRAFVENVEKLCCNVVLCSPLINVCTIEAKTGCDTLLAVQFVRRSARL